MPQLSTALIDEVRNHLIERWQGDDIYQRYANAPTEYEGPPSIRSFIAEMLALPATALRDQRFDGTQKLLGRPLSANSANRNSASCWEPPFS